MFWVVIVFAGRGGRVLDYEEQLGDQLGRGGVHEDGQGPGTLRSGDTLRHPGLLCPPGVREMTGGSHQPQISSQVDTMMFFCINILVIQEQIELSSPRYWSQLTQSTNSIEIYYLFSKILNFFVKI